MNESSDSLQSNPQDQLEEREDNVGGERREPATTTNGRIILIHTCNNRSKMKGLESLFLTGNTGSIGTVIDRNHSKYSFIYNMLTGIKICVLKCNEQLGQLCSDDFTETNRISFDMEKQWPFRRGAFEFKDYAPNVFYKLRKNYGITTVSEYLMNLTNKYEMNEVKSPGKSGSFFYLSNGYHFIVKSVKKVEAKFLLNVLPRYCKHIDAHPDTLLARYCGLHRVSLGGRKKKYFVVMLNIFPPGQSLQEVYDLKGATVGRRVEQREIQNFRVLKDLNLLENERKVQLSSKDKDSLLGRIQDDVSFLALVQVIDYSLLVGICNKQREGGECPSKNNERFQSLFRFNGSKEYDYFIGIIDILTPWSLRKQLEHYLRGICIYRNRISTVAPPKYALRFLEFMETNLFSSENQSHSQE